MMLIVASQGIKHMRDIWRTDLQAQRFPWKRKNLKTGEEEISMVQLAVRPIELHGLVFPEECLGEVLQMMNLNDEHIKNAQKGAGPMMLRKALGAEPVPLKVPRNMNGINIDGKEIYPLHLVSDKGMDVRPIGIIRDKRGPIEFPDGLKYDQEHL